MFRERSDGQMLRGKFIGIKEVAVEAVVAIRVVCSESDACLLSIGCLLYPVLFPIDVFDYCSTRDPFCC
jgi:hypothetical protein